MPYGRDLDKIIRGLFRLPGDWAYVNLDEASAHLAAADPNPCLDPNYCWGWVDHLARQQEAVRTYGGYMEDRSRVWRGSYLPPNGAIHLGVDYNVDPGTVVHCPADCTLVRSVRHTDQDGGWGGQIVLRRGDLYLVLGHLAPYLLPGPEGVEIEKGWVIGQVGAPVENGGWYPHLHVQCCTADDPAVDGYAAWTNDLKDRFPHPDTWLA